MARSVAEQSKLLATQHDAALKRDQLWAKTLEVQQSQAQALKDLFQAFHRWIKATTNTTTPDLRIDKAALFSSAENDTHPIRLWLREELEWLGPVSVKIFNFHTQLPVIAN